MLPETGRLKKTLFSPHDLFVIKLMTFKRNNFVAVKWYLALTLQTYKSRSHLRYLGCRARFTEIKIENSRFTKIEPTFFQSRTNQRLILLFTHIIDHSTQATKLTNRRHELSHTHEIIVFPL